jgi:hypothetical protein
MKLFFLFMNDETKEQSKKWVHTYSPNTPEKRKQTLPAGKLLAALFWVWKEVLKVEFMQQGTIIMSEVFYETLKKANQNKRYGMLTSGVVLLHENERPYTAGRTRALLEHFNWELFDQSPYRLPPVYPPEKLVAFTALQQY